MKLVRTLVIAVILAVVLYAAGVFQPDARTRCVLERRITTDECLKTIPRDTP